MGAGGAEEGREGKVCEVMQLAAAAVANSYGLHCICIVLFVPLAF